MINSTIYFIMELTYLINKLKYKVSFIILKINIKLIIKFNFC